MFDADARFAGSWRSPYNVGSMFIGSVIGKQKEGERLAFVEIGSTTSPFEVYEKKCKIIF